MHVPSDKCDFQGCDNVPYRKYWGRADGKPNHYCQTHYNWLRCSSPELLYLPPANDAMGRIFALTKQLVIAYHKANQEIWIEKGIQ